MKAVICVIQGGPHQGRVASIEFKRFSIGDLFPLDNYMYRIVDGPAAQLIARDWEKKEVGVPNNLAIRLQFAGKANEVN